MHFRVWSRTPVTFKIKLYVKTVKNSFQLLPIFCYKELHLRGRIGLDLKYSNDPQCDMIHKNSKGTGGTPLLLVKSNLGKILKTHPPRYPINISPVVCRIKLCTFNIKWTKWS